MKIAIFGKNFNRDFRKYIQEFFNNLESNNIDVVIYKPFCDYLMTEMHYLPKIESVFNGVEDAPEEVDFLISIGGDGTFLESIRFLKNFNVPVIGLNSGRLGFLANISKEEISVAIQAIIRGEYKLENRSMLLLESESKAFGNFNFALNDATIQKKDSEMITVEAFLDEEYLNTYWTDGLIVSTPTGSTAYNLSAGGPIILPGSNNFSILPIGSHNLTVRPLVIPDSKKIRLEVRSRSGGFMVTVDNRTLVMDATNNVFTLMKASFDLKMLQLPFNNYYATIRNKLMWGVDKRN
jgi:NAD+ kinase